MVVGGTLLAAGLTLGAVAPALAQTPVGPRGWGPGGMMGGYGQGYGPGGVIGGGGMMGGHGPGGMMGGSAQGSAAPLRSLDEARIAFQSYLDRTGDRDLALDEVMEFERNFY